MRGLIRDLEENGIRPAGCVVGEPTSMQPIIAHKGMNRFRCTVTGREAHSSYVTHGVNAIEYAARLVVLHPPDRRPPGGIREARLWLHGPLYDDVDRIDPRRHRVQRHTEGMRVPVRHAHAAECLGGCAVPGNPCAGRHPVARDARRRSAIGHRARMGQPDARARILGERCHRAMGHAIGAVEPDRQGVLRNRGRPVPADGRARGHSGTRRHRRGASARTSSSHSISWRNARAS